MAAAGGEGALIAGRINPRFKSRQSSLWKRVPSFQAMPYAVQFSSNAAAG